ncbi:CHRD domain-containing protein [Granulosicoccus sp. 3-233]|uniref:CHRD domain-containing protein n=1 Tax=Granulosicoccus sp. 3-233 TaxID=3417969 RepID=UPI003D32C68C
MNRSIKNIAALGALCASTGIWAGHTNEVLEAELDGREEVGADPSQRLVGDPDGKGEAYVFGIDGDTTTLCYVLTVKKIQLVPVGEGMAAHIHEGVRDSNGPVVAALAGPEDGNAGDCLTEGETGKFPTEEAGIVQRILNNPEQFYINVHNPAYPDGAIRGQLKSQLHEHDHGDMEPSDGDAPSVPMNLSAQVYSSSALELFWDRSTDTDGFVVAYAVYRDGQFHSSAQGNSYFDEDLSPGTTYSYSVVAIDNLANESAGSAAIEATTGN